MQMGCDVILLPLVLFSLAPFSYTLPEGPPVSASVCRRMMPGVRVGQDLQEGHTRDPQNEAPVRPHSRHPPYFIQVSNSVYEPNRRYQLSVVANQSIGHNFFRGVFVQVRRVRCAFNGTVGVYDGAIGSFELPSASPLKYIECDGNGRSAVSHSLPNWKINETFSWTAPNSRHGHLIIRATVVRDLLTYWTNVNSTILVDQQAGPLPPCRGHHWAASVIVVIFSLYSQYLCQT